MKPGVHSASHVLREISSSILEVGVRHLFEIATVIVGLRQFVRIVVEKKNEDVLRAHLGQLGLATGTPTVGHELMRTEGGDRFYKRFALDRKLDNSRTLIGVISANSQEAANAGQEIDDFSNAVACGTQLGYPICCVNAYGEIEHGRDWTERIAQQLIGCTDPVEWRMNRLSQLFDERSLYPDFMPCGAKCAAAATLVESMRCAGVAVGLVPETQDAESRMRRPIAVMDQAFIACVAMPNGQYRSDGSVVRGALDARWLTIFSSHDLVIESLREGLLLRSSLIGELQVRGRVVEFQ